MVADCEGLDPSTVLQELKGFCKNSLTWHGGNPTERTVDIYRGEKPAIGLAPSGQAKPFAKPPANQGNGTIPWDQMYCKWRLPFKMDGYDMADVRNSLKQCGAKFRGKKNRDGSFNSDGDNCWYAPEKIPGTEFLDQYIEILNNDDDEIPF